MMPRNRGRRALFRALYATLMALGAITLVYHLVLAIYFAPTDGPRHGLLTHHVWCRGQRALLARELDEQVRGLAAGQLPREASLQHYIRKLQGVAQACELCPEAHAALEELRVMSPTRRQLAQSLARIEGL